MNIALLSDTHGHIDDRIKRHVDGCDEVWHAGDIGDLRVTDALADITKVRAVYGNIDDQLARRTWPEHQRFEAGGLQVWMTHRRPTAQIRPRHPSTVAGGTAQPFHLWTQPHFAVQRVDAWGGLHLNPGAAGISGFQRSAPCSNFALTKTAAGSSGCRMGAEASLREADAHFWAPTAPTGRH